ncbi:chemotaxis protein CheW [Pseudanabaena minima]|uniref:chemotaxis protein CheW n=1 Tax=Pseudanabaena minima TaxID=890415 RepID=UPI003DA895A6
MSMQTLFESVDRFQDSKIGAKSDSDVNTCLKFVIDPQTIGLLESEFTQEVLTIKATHIIPVPNKPSCILGILSCRRRVYWAIDLAMLLGLQPLDQNIRLYEVILISAQELSIALVVPKIFGVVNIASDQIEQNINSVPATLRPYFKGYINEREELFYLLKAESIMRSTILHS